MNKKLSSRHRRALLLASLTVLALCLTSCGSADAVSAFATNAAKSLEQGTVVFDDMPASILRRDCFANVENRAFDFKPVDEACVSGDLEQSNLAAAKSERDDLVAIQKVVIDYFNAVQQLAAFGKTSDSADKAKADSSQANSSASKLKSAGKLSSSDEVSAISGVGEIAVRVLSAGYRNRHLRQDIAAADKAIPVITAAFTHVVKIDYMFQPAGATNPSYLNEETKRMREVYQHAEGGPLLLKISWTDRVTKLLARNASAQSYLDALDQIESGHHKLATLSSPLTARGVVGDLQPYISSLASLIPKILKIF